jgi:L-fuconolactonase
MIIDSHHHLWKYDPVEYGWIGNDRLKTDFGTEALAEVARLNGIDGFVSVQARQSLEETEALCRLAQQSPYIKAVVGWVPLADSKIESVLEEKTKLRSLKGVRHVIQGETDDSFWLGDDFNRGVAMLNRFHLTYDLLIYARQLTSAIAFVDRHPTLPMVLDHIAKPTIIADRHDDSWERDFRELAKREHLMCKWSGVATEVRGKAWSIDTIKRYFDVMIETFTPSRIMFGSDWPVCLIATEYDRWLSTTLALLGPLGTDERNRILGDNAAQFYGIM